MIRFVDIVTVLWVLLLSFPQAALIPNYNYVWLGFYIYWFSLVVMKHRIFTPSERQLFYLFVGFLCIVLLECLLFKRYTILHNQIDQSQTLFFFFVYCYYKHTRGIKPLNIITLIVSPFLLFTLVTTVVALIVNPFAARSIYTSGDKVSEEALMLGIGGYVFIYMALLLAIVCFYFCLSLPKKRRLSKGLYFLLFFFLSVLVVLSNFFTATVILALSIASFIVFRKKLRLVPFAILFLIIAPIYKPIANAIIDGASLVVQEEGRTQERLNEIRLSLQGQKSHESLDSRDEPTQYSLNSLKKHPITGVIVDSVLDKDDIGIIGKHSVVLDSLATFGIIIGGFFIILLLLPFRLLFSRENLYERKVYVLLFVISYFLLMYNNNLTAAMGFIAYLIFPMSLEYLRRIDIKQVLIKK